MRKADFTTLVRMMRKLALLVVGFLALSQAAFAEQRIALVIGNGKYQAASLPPLTNPPNDAELMDATLTGLGFKVTRVTDGTQQKMQRAILDFGKALKAAGPDAVGLFYYSGHGIQSDGLNYMVPVDAEVETVQDVQAVAPRMGLVLSQFKQAGNAANFIILDACRNNTLPSETKGADRGLNPEPVSGSGNVFIAYATQPGAVAADGAGANSPYTDALARLMKTEAVPAVNLFIRVGAAVRAATQNRQQPWTENGLSGDSFCFRDCKGSGPSEPPCLTSPPPYAVFFQPDVAVLPDNVQKEFEAWVTRTIKQSDCMIKSVTVKGFSDASPDKLSPDQSKTALALAERRTKSIADMLIISGVSQGIISTDWAVAEQRSAFTQTVQRRAEVWVAYITSTDAINDTLDLILSRGMILETPPKGDIGSRRLDMKLTPDRKFSIPAGMTGTWRTDNGRLCLTMAQVMTDACDAYPAGKRPGDQFVLPSGARVTMK